MSTMNIQLQSIIHLQELDQQISALRAWIEALPRHLQEIEKQLNDIIQSCHNVKEKMAANQRQRWQYDADIQAIEQKVSKYNNQLLDVKSNEEYKALLHEIEFNKSEIRKIEDKILELMIAAERDEEQLKKTEAELKRQEQQVVQEKKEAERATQLKQGELDALLNKREELLHTIGDSIMDLYGRIAKLRDGIVVAEARDQICMVCHVMLRPQTYNEVMRNTEIIQCSNCGRVLYWIPPSQPASPALTPSAEPARD